MGGGGSCKFGGCGTVFKLSKDGAETVLYAFQGGSDGAIPTAGVILDGSGNIYGTTLDGGFTGGGTVFKLSPDGTETQLHVFGGGSDGLLPYGGLVMDSEGDLYGTTGAGGGSTNCGSGGCGTVFEINSGGVESVIYAFQGGQDGADPQAGLVGDADGNYYGTTGEGGEKEARIAETTVAARFLRFLRRVQSPYFTLSAVAATTAVLPKAA